MDSPRMETPWAAMDVVGLPADFSQGMANDCKADVQEVGALTRTFANESTDTCRRVVH